MTLTSKQVLEYLDRHSVRRFNGDFESLLDMLHFIYSDSNPIENTTIREWFRKADGLLEFLPPEVADQLTAITCQLCVEYEKASFAHGILVGMLLMTELNGLP